MAKYGVKVITFVPGSFVTQTSILSKQVDKFYEIQSNFTLEQKEFYGDYFKRYATYLSQLRSPETPCIIHDTLLYETYERALTDVNPKSTYVNETLYYKAYHLMFRYAPTSARDFFIKRFMRMPEYEEDVKEKDLIA